MSETTYTKVIKFQYSQRLWKGSDHRYYLADESADYRGRAGTPDETEDGPLVLILDEPIRCDWYYNTGTCFMATVLTTRTGDRNSVGLSGNAALWLAAHLGMTIKSRDGEFRINPLPKETS